MRRSWAKVRERERENDNINDEGGVLRYVRRERELEDCDKILGERNNNYRLNLGISILWFISNFIFIIYSKRV